MSEGLPAYKSSFESFESSESRACVRWTAMIYRHWWLIAMVRLQ